MANREQVVAEELKEQSTSTGRKGGTVYYPSKRNNEQLMDEIRSYCQQARELREQVAVLQQLGCRFSG
ncbi:hypothetical protein P4H71_11970 [Paenibacillus kribbensis]|uniref:hypothetical protein n=1 Tax=Paenibacillus kribbensis TaxID=172713 RepID=UPI002DBC2B37|nr:hypothetical protein [Paenibacillus kribbensis]MEC0235045.1 hypothetical protein [Paenibacillus kribbensis]